MRTNNPGGSPIAAALFKYDIIKKIVRIKGHYSSSIIEARGYYESFSPETFDKVSVRFRDMRFLDREDKYILFLYFKKVRGNSFKFIVDFATTGVIGANNKLTLRSSNGSGVQFNIARN